MEKDIQIIPLGGVNEIGKNMYVLRYKDEMIVIDSGVMFPDDEMLGIDYVIPDMSFLIENKEKVKAVFLTHGHEDHIGSLPYFLQEIDVPVYGTTLTLGLVRPKLKEFKLSDEKFRQVHIGDRVTEGSFKVEFIRVNHSIPDGAALAITTPAGVIIHSGDFKFDQTPIDGKVTDYHRFADYGNNGVLALLCDSTNANKDGYTPSEREVGETFDSILKNNPNRVLMATFASNIHRIQQAFTLAEKHGRKVAVIGRSMINNVGIATELGYLDMPPNTLIDINEIDNYSPDKLLILCTGSQGEPLAALTRMAFNKHYQITLGAYDTVIMSSNPIPGNEKLVNRVLNALTKTGATVITSKSAKVHVSGHASAEELKMLFHLVKPKYIVPFHGEYQHKHACRELAISLGYEKDNVFLLENGDVLELCEDNATVVDTVEAGRVLIDGRGIGDVGRIVLRDRHMLAQYGVLTSIVVISSDKKSIVAGPTIITRGFVFVKESEDLIEEAIALVTEAIEELLKSGKTGWAPLKNKMRQVLQDYLYEETGRKPMILPIIMEV
jgi:ribonuclease J